MNRSPLIKLSIQYGAVAGGLAAALLIASFYLGRHPLMISPYLDFRILLFGIFIFFSLKELRDYEQGGELYFWQGMLGGALLGQKKYTEAEPLLRRALAISEKTIGPEDPAIAPQLNNLALLYVAQGRYLEAETLFKRSLAIREKVLGPQHPATAYTLEPYASLLRKMRRDEEAARMEARAQAIRAKQGRD